MRVLRELQRFGPPLSPFLLCPIFLWLAMAFILASAPTYDEENHLRYGEKCLEGDYERGGHTFNSKMPISSLNYLVLKGFRDTGLLKDEFFALLPARAGTFLLALLLFTALFLSGEMILGKGKGFIPLIFFVFHPDIVAHSSLVTTDLAATLGIFSTLMGYLYLLKNPSPTTLILAGLLSGGALLSKYTSLHLAPLLLLSGLLGALKFREWKGRGRPLLHPLISLIPILLMALLVINIAFRFRGTFTTFPGWAVRNHLFMSHPLSRAFMKPPLSGIPLPLPYDYAEGLFWVFSDNREGHQSYLLGEYSDKGFWNYYIVAFLLKVPIPLTLFLVPALISGFRRRSFREDLFLIIPPLYLFLYFSLFFNFQLGTRYILPIFPFLFILASKGVVELLAGKVSRYLVPPLILFYIYSPFRVFPHFLSYFNELAGKPANWWRLLIDSNLDWGQDEGLIREFLARNRGVVRNPVRPVGGRVLVGVNDLVGIMGDKGCRFGWIRENFEPSGMVGYSGILFDLPPIAGLPADGFSVEWEGFMEVKGDDRYTISIHADGGVRLVIDGRVMIDSPHDRGLKRWKRLIELKKGSTPILLEYRDTEGDASISFRAFPEHLEERVFRDFLHQRGDGGVGRGITGRFYEGSGLYRLLRFERTYPAIHFDWGCTSPFAILP